MSVNVNFNELKGRSQDNERSQNTFVAVPTPANIEAEQAALGCALLAPNECIPKLAVDLQPEDFAYEPHRLIYEVLCHLHERGDPIDLITVADELKRIGELDSCGGIPYLMCLMETPPSVTNLDAYISRIKQAATKRKALRILQENLRAVALPENDLLATLATLIQDVQSITDDAVEHEDKPISATELVSATPSVEWLAEPLLPKRGLVLIAGAPGVGKSLLMLWAALRLCEGKPLFESASEMLPTKPVKVLYVDLENSQEIVAERLREFGVSSQNLLWWSPQKSIDLLRPEGIACLSKVIREYQPDIVMLDALIRFHNADENRANEMKQVLEVLSKLRRKHEVTFLIAHHNRKATPFGGGADDVRGSGEIRAVPDIVFIVRRPKNSNTLIVDVAKNRCRSLTFGKFRISLRRSASGQLQYHWEGAVEDSESAVEDAAKWILNQLEVEPTTVKRLLTAGVRNGMSVATLRRAIKHLESEGAIVSWRAPNPDGSGRVKWVKIASGSDTDDPSGAQLSAQLSAQFSAQHQNTLSTKEQKNHYSETLFNSQLSTKEQCPDGLEKPLLCPACETPLEPDSDGTAACIGCGRAWKVCDGQIEPL